MNYASTADGQHCEYSLEDGELRVFMSGEGNLSVPLRGGNVAIKRSRYFSTKLRIGYALFAVSAFAIAVITLKEGFRAVALSQSGFALMIMMGLGSILITAGGRSRRCCFVTTDGDGIVIWQDPAKPREFEDFVKAVEEETRLAVPAA